MKYNHQFFSELKGENTIKKVLYVGWIGYKNLGDDLLWDLFRYKFNKILADKEWKLKGTYMRTSIEEYNLDTHDLIVLGGGSIICKNNIPLLYEAIKRGKKVLIWGSGIDLIQLNHIPLLLEGKRINVDKYFTKDIQKKLIEVIEHAEFVGVRGPLTYEIIKQMGANEDKMMICGDPGFLLSERTTFKEEDKVSFPSTNKVIGVNWGTSFNRIYGANERQLENSLVNVIKSLIQKGYKIHLYTVWDQDIPALKSIYHKINDQENVILDTTLYHQDALIDLISNFSFTINFKLHANIISIAAGTPPIALAYRFKVFDFAHSLNLEDFVISTDSTDLETKIMELELLISQDRPNIIEKIKKTELEYMHLINKPFDEKLYL
ncbi:polysaccharide pyruvyl transferase family protein [Bacillus sp. SCS-151]|uniref:polysaccharide pyruvyl transferase family protein n=1 Tax=Nanhaiella sioensis TaxID=3115293 RepID=UPI00397B4E90